MVLATFRAGMLIGTWEAKTAAPFIVVAAWAVGGRRGGRCGRLVDGGLLALGVALVFVEATKNLNCPGIEDSRVEVVVYGVPLQAGILGRTGSERAVIILDCGETKLGRCLQDQVLVADEL